MLLNLLSYIIIPVYTVLFVRGSNWFTCNFSVIGNVVQRRDAFVLWGLLVGLYFYRVLRTIVKHMEKKPKGTFLIPFCLCLLFFAITTPYLPDEMPFKAFLHIIFAFFAAVFLIICLYLIVWQLYRSSPAVYKPYLAALLGITLGSAFLLYLVGIVSSALEIFFTISTVILVRCLLRRVAA